LADRESNRERISGSPTRSVVDHDGWSSTMLVDRPCDVRLPTMLVGRQGT
jgi:hypothetical protein